MDDGRPQSVSVKSYDDAFWAVLRRQQFIAKPSQAGLPIQAPIMWIIVSAMGAISFIGIYIYDKLIVKKTP